jgi:uncharacterized protein YbjT (DUF2867 family)
MATRIAVAGGTGTVGRLVTEFVRQRGHDAVVLSRSTGIDLVTGAGLDTVLAGVDAVIDVSNTLSMSAAASIRHFQTTAQVLATAELRAGVRHHVLLSIVGVDAPHTSGYGYYRGKLAQERAVAGSGVPWTLLRATQFHEFAQQLFQRTRFGPFVLVPAMRAQPVAAREVAARLVELAEGAPAGRVSDVAGPRVERIAELARRYARAAGASGVVVELPLPGAVGRAMRQGGLLPAPAADVRGPAYADWLLEQTGSDGVARMPRTVGIAGIPIMRSPLPAPPEPSLSNARELVARLRTAGMPIALTVHGDERRLPAAVDQAAFRALQEAVSLVLMRTRGVEADAVVRYLPHAVEIEVTHGAARLTPQASRSETLNRSRAQVRRLGGAVSSGPTTEGGFRLAATIPIPTPT